MPALSKIITDLYKERIREIMIMAPAWGNEKIQRALRSSREPLNADVKFIGKLRSKILREQQLGRNKERIAVFLNRIKEENQLIKTHLWSLASSASTNYAKIQALTAIAKINKDWIDSNMAAGVLIDDEGQVVKDERPLLNWQNIIINNAYGQDNRPPEDNRGVVLHREQESAASQIDFQPDARIAVQVRPGTQPAADPQV